MVRVGIAGLGFMGMIHYRAYQKARGARVAAICEQDPARRAGDWRTIKGNFGPRGTRVDLSGIAQYGELDALIDDPDVDLVDICLPPSLHADTAVAALRAGKHVFCEKPMALTPADCRRMAAAAERAGKLLMVGHVLPLFPEYARARKVIASGRYGRLLGGFFKRVISDPLWIRDFWDPRLVGGPMLDLHIHDAHLIRLLFGMPVEVVSQGRMRGEVVEYCNTQFRFADRSLAVAAAAGVINQQGRSFTHGFEIHLEQATLHYELAIVRDQPQLSPLTIFDAQGRAVRPKLGDGDPELAFQAEIKEVVRCAAQNRPSAILGAELARDAVVLCHKQTRSVRTGRPVKV